MTRKGKRQKRRHATTRLAPVPLDQREVSHWDRTGEDKPLENVREMREALTPEQLAARLHTIPGNPMPDWLEAKLQRLERQKAMRAQGWKPKKRRHRRRRQSGCARCK